MGGAIFLRQDGELIRLEEAQYDSEDLLQSLLAKTPDLLAGDQIDERKPRKWLLIRREAGIPDREGGASRWSVDHVFVDQEGIPTLVEVKRSSDTRLRREVVGQLLEYAANLAKWWPAAQIRREFEEDCSKREQPPEEELRRFLGREADIEAFWQGVEDHLKLGRLRLLFVSDWIPRELRRIVEFLNEQMTHTQVLAVEIRQYTGEGRQTLVPRVLGITSAGEDKGPRTGVRDEPWDRESFLAQLAGTDHAEDVGLARRILDWAEARGLYVEGGQGAVTAGVYLALDVAEETLWPLSLYEGSRRAILHVQFNYMNERFEDQKRRALCDKLNRIPGLELPWDKQYPGIPFTLLRSANAERLLFEGLDWLVEQLSEIEDAS